MNEKAYDSPTVQTHPPKMPAPPQKANSLDPYILAMFVVYGIPIIVWLLFGIFGPS